MSLQQQGRALTDLLAVLRTSGYTVGVDQYLSARRLYVMWAEQKADLSPAVVRASLASIFCINPQQQSRFGPLFDTWHNALSGVQPEPPPSPAKPKAERPGWSRLPSYSLPVWFRRSLGCLLVGLLLLAPVRLAIEPDVDDITEPSKPQTPAGEPQTTPYTIKPRYPPEPIQPPPAFEPETPLYLEYIPLLPVLCWALWGLPRLCRRFLILSRGRSAEDEHDRLESLHLKKDPGALFSESALRPLLKRWRGYQQVASKRLHEARTVAANIAQQGLFQPSYRQRAVPKEHVLLIDRRHSNDLMAAMADDFGQQLNQQAVHLSHYAYDTDPRYCRAAIPDRQRYRLGHLASRHPWHHLLVIGAARNFFDHRGRPLWSTEDTWSEKTLLSVDSAYHWGEAERKLIEAGFRIAPFSHGGFSQLASTHADTHPETILRQSLRLDLDDQPLPVWLSPDDDIWWQERPPRRRQAALVKALSNYLSDDGLILLAAIASYPLVFWRLTVALELQLMLSVESRANRLRSLARLPWSRHGQIPDVWRTCLLRSLKSTQVEKIAGAYQALLNHRDDTELRLPVRVPEWRRDKKQTEYIHTAPSDDALQDQVFARVIRGKKPSRLEFSLPKRYQNWFPPQYWRGLGGVLAGLMVALAATGWLQNYFSNAVKRPSAQIAMQRALNGYRIQIYYADKRLEEHAIALREIYQNWGFQSAEPRPVGTKQTQNHLHYAPDIPPFIRRIAAQRLRYLSYGATLVEANEISVENQHINVYLERIIQPGSVYRDAIFNYPAYQMVKIPAGCLQIGSPDSDNDADGDEIPQHEVCIKTPFYIGQYEVTFADYQLFTESTGDQLPDDEGWGQGDRPVINVSWDDAVAYAAWLSKMSGRHYRLPTEAEWEYAARGGTQTGYWWGDGFGTGNAVCYDCGSQWDAKQTAPVGSFKANPFGLYDTAGNVWEWVQDCFHDDYQGAPADGSAWAESDGQECGLRVLRGGSWYNYRGGLRSANRGRDGPAGRGDGIGFRLAQDI